MAVTVNTILRSAKSRGAFIGLTLKTRDANTVLEGSAKVQSVSPSYVTLAEYDQDGYRNTFKVSKATIMQVRSNGLVRNTRRR